MEIKWNNEKNEVLKSERGLSFEEVLDKISAGDILDIRTPPNLGKYPHQKAFVIKINNKYCYVPFVENENGIFLKTIFPDRRLKKEFVGGGKK